MNIKKISLIIYTTFAVALISCNSEDDNQPLAEQGLTTTADVVLQYEKALRSQEVSLQLIDANGADQTSEATFYADGEELEGATFSSETVNAYQIQASYMLNGAETTTEVQTIEVIIPKRKIVLEIFTGTWCGYCPRKKPAVESLRALTENVAVVAVHGNSIYTSTDPFTIEDGIFLKDHLQIPGFPTGVVNRETFWNLQSSTTASQPFVQLAGQEVPVSISIASEISNNTLSVTSELVSEVALNNHTIVVYLLENGILYDQASYYDGDANSPFFGMGNPLEDFEHNEVLREILTDPLGDVVSAVSPLTPQKFTYTTSIPSEFNQTNLSLVVALYNENGVAVNAQFAKVNEHKRFD